VLVMVHRRSHLLIHLDHYYDWSPQASYPSGFASSGVSGLPPSSSSSSERPFPFYTSFSWLPGVMDGHSGARTRGSRLQSCRHAQPCRWSNDDPEDDGRGRGGRDWHCNINARGCLANDLPRGNAHGRPHRT
jgi:hypothetical protein